MKPLYSRGNWSLFESLRLAILPSFLFLTLSQALDVTAFIPAGNVDQWKTALQSDWGGVANAPRNTITRICADYLGVELDGSITVLTPQIPWLQEYCGTHGKKFMLMVNNWDNAKNDFGWDLARAGFKTHREKFVNELLVLVVKYKADGIDIDFEDGVTRWEEDRKDFAEFIKLLGERLHAQGKELTVDVFRGKFCSPAFYWSDDWVGYADRIHVMGYDRTFEGSPDDEGKYSWHQKYGVSKGYKPSQIVLGLRSLDASWGSGGRGVTPLAHIKECLLDCPTAAPICIWDATFPNASWQADSVWILLHSLSSKPDAGPDGLIRKAQGSSDGQERRRGQKAGMGVLVLSAGRNSGSGARFNSMPGQSIPEWHFRRHMAEVFLVRQRE